MGQGPQTLTTNDRIVIDIGGWRRRREEIKTTPRREEVAGWKTVIVGVGKPPGPAQGRYPTAVVIND